MHVQSPGRPPGPGFEPLSLSPPSRLFDRNDDEFPSSAGASLESPLSAPHLKHDDFEPKTLALHESHIQSLGRPPRDDEFPSSGGASFESPLSAPHLKHDDLEPKTFALHESQIQSFARFGRPPPSAGASLASPFGSWQLKHSSRLPNTVFPQPLQIQSGLRPPRSVDRKRNPIWNVDENPIEKKTKGSTIKRTYWNHFNSPLLLRLPNGFLFDELVSSPQPEMKQCTHCYLDSKRPVCRRSI